MNDYMVTITPRGAALRVSAFEIGFGGGNTTGSKVAEWITPRYATDLNMVKEFVFANLGPQFDVRPGDVPSLFFVTVYDA